ncbi:sensor histidine kinase [Nocardioides speluncae]|uniref:sensor histidine kinase n=1 Tax=Nocardioides speluncae TaxID=2670337 RepID=UPI000D69D66D|nr:ATP-binding protein [Nocardioides speluncae]
MWSRRRPVTLAGQFLLLQLAVLLAVLAVASVVSVRQSEDDFRDTRGVFLRRGAERLAGTQNVRDELSEPPVSITLASYAEAERRHLDADSVYLADPEGRVLSGTNRPAVGTRVDLSDSTVLDLRAWTGDVDDRGRNSIATHVPVLSDRGDLIGIVVVTEEYPSLAARARAVLPDLVGFLGLGLLLGVAGSWLLSRLIRRRTRGLEPTEIAALADQREALLHSLREGVVAVSPEGIITVISDSAREVLGLPATREGERVDRLELDPTVRDALTGTTEAHDDALVVGGRVLVLNRSRVVYDGRHVGTVTTLRDRTELLALESELTARQGITDTLRAQTHEFQNQLHTISGLIQLEEYDDVTAFVSGLTRRRAAISDAVTARVADPAVAALAIAKVSLAAERGVELRLGEDSALPRLDPELSGDVGTVLGNLVDNAVDATVTAGGDRVDVRLVEEDGAVIVEVADGGAGVPDDVADAIFRRGYSTKPADPADSGAGRGVGLALVRVVSERRGGSVSVRNDRDHDRGAVFTVRLPAGRTRP